MRPYEQVHRNFFSKKRQQEYDFEKPLLVEKERATNTTQSEKKRSKPPAGVFQFPTEEVKARERHLINFVPWVPPLESLPRIRTAKAKNVVVVPQIEERVENPEKKSPPTLGNLLQYQKECSRQRFKKMLHCTCIRTLRREKKQFKHEEMSSPHLE